MTLHEFIKQVFEGEKVLHKIIFFLIKTRFNFNQSHYRPLNLCILQNILGFISVTSPTSIVNE